MAAPEKNLADGEPKDATAGPALHAGTGGSEPARTGANSGEAAPGSPSPPAATPPLGEYDSVAGDGKTVAQAALEGAQTELETSQAASERAEEKLETAKAELDSSATPNIEPPATGRRPSSPFYSPDEWRLMAWTFGLGALGGFLAFVLGFESTKGVPIISTILSGGMAAVIAVFFLARTDTDKRIHLTLFAVLCGIIGSPIVKETVSSFGKNLGVEDALKNSQASSELATDLKESVATPEGRAEAGKTLQMIEKKAEEALETSAKEDPTVKSAVGASVENTVAALQQIAPAAPAETLRAVENIGVTAAANGQTKVAERALAAARQLSTHNSVGTREAAAATVDGLNRALKIMPRVKLELGTGIDPSSLNGLKGRVANEGYILEGPNQLPVPDGVARVVYYDRADKKEAEWLVEKLAEAGVRSPRAEEQAKPTGFQPRSFDVQLGSGSLP